MNAESLSHPNQVGHGIGFHLPHHARAMNLYRFFGGTQLRASLLVQ
jgi:hypothetical protein